MLLQKWLDMIPSINPFIQKPRPPTKLYTHPWVGILHRFQIFTDSRGPLGGGWVWGCLGATHTYMCSQWSCREVMFSVLSVCSPGDLMWPLPMMYWTSLYRAPFLQCFECLRPIWCCTSPHPPPLNCTVHSDPPPPRYCSAEDPLADIWWLATKACSVGKRAIRLLPAYLLVKTVFKSNPLDDNDNYDNRKIIIA